MTAAAAATAAWLARIPASERIAAHAYTDWRLTAWAVAGLTMIIACIVLARIGAIASLRRRIDAGGPRPWVAAAAAAGLVALVLATLSALADAVTQWRGEQILQRGGQSLPAHLIRSAAGIAPTVVVAILFVPLALWLMRRLPRAWPLVVGGAGGAVILAAVWLPYALAVGPPSTPLPPGPMRDALARLIADIGIPAHDVMLVADPSFSLDVNGGFGHAVVAVGPMLAAGPPAEARAIVAHVMGHYAHNDVLIFSLVLGLVMLAGFFAVGWWAAPLARLLGARSVDSAATPEALPAAAIILMLAMTGAGLAAGAYLLWANVRADAYSLDHAREPDGLASILEREWDHQSLDPSPIETALFYTHPPLPTRIAHAMAWKASHAGNAIRTTAR